MKRVALAIISTITGLVMLLSFKTHALDSTASASAVVSTTTSGNSSSASTASSTQSVSSTKTVTGKAVNTVYGPVAVKITVKAGNVISATAVEYPNNDPRDAQINSYAIPVLNSEAVKADSANIAHVSGATYTSGGYIASLQNALNKAGI